MTIRHREHTSITVGIGTEFAFVAMMFFFASCSVLRSSFFVLGSSGEVVSPPLPRERRFYLALARSPSAIEIEITHGFPKEGR